jgi:hypothetical protein
MTLILNIFYAKNYVIKQLWDWLTSFVYWIQPYVIKIVRNLQEVDGFLCVSCLVSSTNKNWLLQYNWNILESSHDITEIFFTETKLFSLLTR